MVTMTMLQHPLVFLLAIAFVWWSQGWIFHKIILRGRTSNLLKKDNNQVHRTRFRIQLGLYMMLYTAITYVLAYGLHESLRQRHIVIKPALFIILWYPLGMQWLRYCHLLAVGPTKFMHEFGLQHLTMGVIGMKDKKINSNNSNDDNTKWIRLFIRISPTIIFGGASPRGGDENPSNSMNNNDNDDDDKYGKKKVSYKEIESSTDHQTLFKTMLIEFLLTVGICGLVLFLDAGTWLPAFLQRVLRVYIMGLTTFLIRLVHEYPIVKYWGRSLPPGSRIIPLYDQTYLTKRPRELWRRWSVTAGYHLRKGYYEPLLPYLKASNDNQFIHILKVLLATSIPFLVNCIMHIYWWSMGVKGSIDHVYWVLLFAYPLFSFAMEDIVSILFFGGSNKGTTSSWQHDLCNMVLLWIGFYLVGEPMSQAHAMNSDLTTVCRANLLLPPIPTAATGNP